MTNPAAGAGQQPGGQHGGSNATLIKSEVDFQRLINGECDRLVSRASNLLQNKSFTDVTFIVGPPQNSKKYVGHRVLLAMTSPVFEAMFYGDMADKSKVIRIPDVAPIGFENLLRYAYTDSLNLNSVEDAMLTAYAAKKYLLPHLLKECLTFIEKNITPSTACAVYEFANVLNSQQLVYLSMSLIDRQTYHVITHKSFNNIQLTTLEFIASRKYLNLYSEYSLFNSIIQWAISESKRRALNPNDWAIIRHIVEDSMVFRNIRFLTLTNEELARAIASTSASNLGGSSGVGGPPGMGGKHGGDDEDSEEPTAVVGRTENAFLNKSEQIALFMNLAIGGIIAVPRHMSHETHPRVAPPEFFIVRRYKPAQYATATTLAHASTGGAGPKLVKQLSTKFQVLNADIFITGAAVPIRLDPGYFSVRAPRLECQLKFTTRIGPASEGPMGGRGEESLLLDTVDETVTLVVSKDKDCILKLKKPLSTKRGHVNDLTITLSVANVNDDLVVVKGHRSKTGQMEVLDGEQLQWVFFKTNNLEFNELYYYY